MSERTQQKIIQKHGITAEEVRDAVMCVPGLDFAWHDHAQRGLRAIIKARIRGRKMLVVLYPAESAFGDAWHLGSAYFTDGY